MMLRALGFPRSPFRWARAQTLRCRLAITAREKKGLASRAIVPVPLSYAIFDGPSSDPPLVFLHGLFGSKSNFSSLVKKLVLQTGRKPELVERLVCVDISPSPTKDVSGFQDFIAAMKAVDIPRGIPRSTARRMAEEQLRPTIQEPTILYFLLTNLVNAEDQFVWRVNLEAISQHLKDLMSFPDFQTSYLGPTLFLGGSKSGYISSNNYSEIKRLFPDAEIQHIPNAGHWVHADQPQEFITAICNFLALHPL
ncbi:protein ABHD11 isoform X2 [Crotalus tigris]|uniref:protein ABHD11 isoform X2 n=1 Tax=Crotalus tigris TaxID=88082 RepID=UPI00192FA24E|nr:protein ABHD11 isoform X2 [Crotalus tigris]